MTKLDVAGVPERVSTGELPGGDKVETLVEQAYAHNKHVTTGAVADYIPALATADPEAFGICVAEVDGNVHVAGQTEYEFTIQSISKAFVYALVCQHMGHELIGQRIGVNNTGFGFDSVVALELNGGNPMNPMVNAGAIATSALVPGSTPTAKWECIRDGLSRFAGRSLEIDSAVYESESGSNMRNRGIAQLLESYGRLDVDPRTAVDVYTKQCALQISARDLAIMGATLADGGVNPVTGDQVVGPTICRDTLAVLAANGLYQRSGEWLFEIGVPGKSGVSGGIVTIAPGKAGLATFSPLLDRAGNSVRGQLATAHLTRTLGLNIFMSNPYPLRQGDR